MDIDFKRMAEDWPSPFVARSAIEEFIKGLYKPRSLNVFDGAGRGIRRKIQIGSKIAYLKEDVIEWIKQRKKK